MLVGAALDVLGLVAELPQCVNPRSYNTARPVCDVGRDEPERLQVGNSRLIGHGVSGQKHFARRGEVWGGVAAIACQLG